MKAEFKVAGGVVEEAEADLEAWEARLEAKEAGTIYVPKEEPKKKKKGKAAKKGKGKSKAKGKKKAVVLSDSDDDEDDSDEAIETDEEEEEAEASDDSSDSSTPRKKKARKSKGSDDDDDDSDVVIESDDEEEEDDGRVKDVSEDMSEREVKDVVKEKKEVLKGRKKEKSEARKAVDSATAAVTKLEKKIAKLQREKNRRCALARNSYSRRALAEDFRRGLRILDDEVAEKAQGANWNPEEAQRDYDAINLPVFCVSAREFAKLSGLALGDGKAQVFSSLKETGIPALRKHAKALTLRPRYVRASALLKDVRDLVSSVRMVLSSDGSNDDDSKAVRSAYNTEIVNFRHGLAKLAKEGKDSAAETFEDIRERLGDGSENASAKASSAIRFYDAMHWGSYRATTRRNGVFTNAKGAHNFNEALCKPLIEQLSACWERTFADPERLVGGFKRACLRAVDDFANTLSLSAAPSSQAQFEQVAKVTKANLENRLEQWIQVIVEALDARQKTASRAVEPAYAFPFLFSGIQAEFQSRRVQTYLANTYYASSMERGTGSSYRMKAMMCDFVDKTNSDMFENATEAVMTELDSIAEDIEEKLNKAAEDAIKVVRNNFSLLWEKMGIPDMKTLALRKAVLSNVEIELIQVEGVLGTTESAPAPAEIGIEELEGEDSDNEESANIIRKRKEAANVREKKGKKGSINSYVKKPEIIEVGDSDEEMKDVDAGPPVKTSSPVIILA
ncbi:hypothetical protein P7C70_g8231, partial [Phenoliferia sp. Uapishka_3]